MPSFLMSLRAASQLTLLSWLLRPCHSFLAGTTSNHARQMITRSLSSHVVAAASPLQNNNNQMTSLLTRAGPLRPQPTTRSSTATFASAGAGGEAPFRTIGMAEMTEILDEYEQVGRDESMYCVIDVRMPDEVAATGKLADNVYNVPVQALIERNAFGMDEDDFEEAFGFAKPTLDETVVFSCAAGIRSVYACQTAAANGYSNLINYSGGANEWFSGRNW